MVFPWSMHIMRSIVSGSYQRLYLTRFLKHFFEKISNINDRCVPRSKKSPSDCTQIFCREKKNENFNYNHHNQAIYGYVPNKKIIFVLNFQIFKKNFILKFSNFQKKFYFKIFKKTSYQLRSTFYSLFLIFIFK